MTAEELLNNNLENGIAAYTATPETEPHIVVNADRTIKVPDELKKIAVQNDHNIETVTFDCPRYWDGHDMSEMKVFINYKTPDNKFGSYPADNLIVDESDSTIIHFDWVISRNVTHTKGQLSFIICINKTDAAGNEVNHWNSELNKEMYIAEGLECDESIIDEYPDIITAMFMRLDSLKDGTGLLDTSLVQSGFPADSKAVGDALGYITPQLFGAKGDGETDDTAAIQSSIDGSNYIFIPAGTYKITNTITVGSKKHIIFDKCAKLSMCENLDAVSMTGNDTTIENLNIDTTPATAYTSSALAFNAHYNENILITDAIIKGVQNTSINTDPYVSFAQQEYPHGFGIRFYKPQRYACNVRIIRPTVIGFSCALQVYVGPSTDSSTPWVTELYVTDFIFKNMAHAIEVSSGWIEACTFTGYVQCHLEAAAGQQYWSIYGGDYCFYDVRYWDSNKKSFFVPSTARPIIRRMSSNRLLCDDFGRTIWLDNRASTKGYLFSKGICSNDMRCNITKLEFNKYNVHTDGDGIYLLFKDDFGNYLLQAESGGEKKIEFTIKADYDCKVVPYLSQKMDGYNTYDAAWPYVPAYKVVGATENTITLDNVVGLSPGDSLLIWGYPDETYKYPVSPNESWIFTGGHNAFVITRVNTDTDTVTVQQTIANTDLLVGQSVSKKYKNTYTIHEGTTVTSTEKRLSYTIELEDFTSVLKPNYILLGVMVTNPNGVSGNVEISDVRITI